MKFSEEQKEAARRAMRDYEHWVEMCWDEMEFDLELRLGLSDEQVKELVEEVQ